MPDQTEHLTALVEENTGLLEQGVALIGAIDADVYSRNSHDYFTSGVGKHFRHILDFYDRFLHGAGTIVDYEARNRDARIESDPEYAISVARSHEKRLRSLVQGSSGAARSTPVVVRNEVIDEQGNGILADSSVERELAVLASHTVHHYAIIAMLLRVQGIEVDHSFGVAPSTLRYLAAKNA